MRILKPGTMRNSLFFFIFFLFFRDDAYGYCELFGAHLAQVGFLYFPTIVKLFRIEAHFGCEFKFVIGKLHFDRFCKVFYFCQYIIDLTVFFLLSRLTVLPRTTACLTMPIERCLNVTCFEKKI